LQAKGLRLGLLNRYCWRGRVLTPLKKPINVGAGLPALGADQTTFVLLTHRNRRQASSHI
jgi:hypothetical protein